MKKKKLLILLLLLSVVSISCLKEKFNQDRVCIDGKCVNVEIAQSREERELGLQHRESLDKNAGMLFIFPRSGKHSFWMKDTLIPLDMIWINHYHEIVYIQKNAEPCQMYPFTVYTPTREALYVLEVNAGYVKEKGIKVGQRADFKLKSNQ